MGFCTHLLSCWIRLVLPLAIDGWKKNVRLRVTENNKKLVMGLIFSCNSIEGDWLFVGFKSRTVKADYSKIVSWTTSIL